MAVPGIYGISVDTVSLPNVRPNIWKTSYLHFATAAFTVTPATQPVFTSLIKLNVYEVPSTIAKPVVFTWTSAAGSKTPLFIFTDFCNQVSAAILAQTGLSVTITPQVIPNSFGNIRGSFASNYTIEFLSIPTSILGIPPGSYSPLFETIYPPTCPSITVPIDQYDILQLQTALNTAFAASIFPAVVSVISSQNQRYNIAYPNLVLYRDTVDTFLDDRIGLTDTITNVSSINLQSLTSLQGDTVLNLVSDLSTTKYAIDVKKQQVLLLASCPLNGAYGTYTTTQPFTSASVHYLDYKVHQQFTSFTVEVQDVDGVPVDIGTAPVFMVVRFWKRESMT